MSARDVLLKSLESLSLAPGNEQNGLDFYKHIFTHHQDLRRFFKGAENYTANDIQHSERFAKQGQRILLALHILAASSDDPELIRAMARDQVVKHRRFRMDAELFHAFFPIWLGFLATRGVDSAEAKAAWLNVGKIFGDECVRYTKEQGFGI